MTDFKAISNNDIRFVADTHFRSREVPGEARRRDVFIRFLRSLPEGAALYLLGDIFDFYYEYRSVVGKRFVDLFAEFLACGERGIEMHFLGGNHDYWVGDFITEGLGMTLHWNEILICAQGRKIVCAHGDLAMPGDWGYKFVRPFIRNRLLIGASRWIHPDIMDAIARAVATGSRKMSKEPQEANARRVSERAHREFYTRGNDAFIMGHVHYPLLDSRDGNDFMLVGDWFESFTYGRLSDGELTLNCFTDEVRD